MRKRMPRIPPRSDERNTFVKFTVSSGYLSWRMNSAGSVNMAPATMAPEHDPIDCTITFSPRAFLRPSALDRPTAMMAIGIAASNTWPTLSPR